MADDVKTPEELRQDLERDAFKTVLSTRAGRRFLWQLLGDCGLTKNPFTGDNNATNFNCGRQSVATDLLVKIDAYDPSAFTQMSREAKEEETYANRSTDDTSTHERDTDPDGFDAILG